MPSVTQPHCSSDFPALSLSSFQSIGLFPIHIQTSCNFSRLKFFCFSQDTARCHSNTSGSAEGNMSLTLEGQYLYLFFQLLLSRPLLKLFHCSFHPTTVLKRLSGCPAFDTVNHSFFLDVHSSVASRISEYTLLDNSSFFILGLFFLSFLLSSHF